MADFATQYKSITSSGSEVADFERVVSANRGEQGHLGWINDTQLLPVLARVHLVVSLAARQEPGEVTYNPAIVVNPVVTLWNPYSVAINVGDLPYFVELNEAAAPFTLTFQAGNLPPVVRDLGQITASTNSGTPGVNVSIPIGSTSRWLPGEVRVFSGATDIIDDVGQGSNLTLAAGYRPNAGFRYEIPGFQPQPSTTTLSVTRAVNSAVFNGRNVQGVGFYYTIGTQNRNGTPKDRNIQCMMDLEDAQRFLGEEIALRDQTNPPNLASLENTPRPIIAVLNTLRFARDVNPEMLNVMPNGIAFMNPMVGYSVAGSTDTDSFPAIKGRYDTFPYDIQLFAVNSLTDPGVPSGLTDDLQGYLGSGFGSNDGLSNLILVDIPTRPLRTIGDLEHLNVNAPDFGGIYPLNAFGNSTANPFIEPSEIRISSGGNEIGHDHSYAFNHVMLDDWFVSSVTPRPSDWSSGGGSDVEEVYAAHLSGEESLPNYYYRPVSSEADPDFLDDDDAWQKIAAEFEVDGMFNVNSTSEVAWAMLLKRNFAGGDPGVLTLENATPGSTNASASLESDNGSPFPRTTLTSADNGGLATLAEPPRFSDDQIDALAREIVEEIKKRGPFLSLSEFFNRQLTDDTELARAGAVESALTTLSESSGNENPYSDLQSAFGDEASTSDAQGGSLNFAFSEAAEGNPAYGFPGWTRQADVLRSLSGVLSARDDTFTIRAYGDARDDNGNIISKAWCEATVQRTAEYVDNSDGTGDDKFVLPGADTLDSEANKTFGRRFKLVQFRWLNPDEV